MATSRFGAAFEATDKVVAADQTADEKALADKVPARRTNGLVPLIARPLAEPIELPTGGGSYHHSSSRAASVDGATAPLSAASSSSLASRIAIRRKASFERRKARVVVGGTPRPSFSTAIGVM